MRTLYDISVDRGADDIITIRLKGSGFLYNMVRIIAGTLMKVGMGVWPPEHVKEILEARDRKEAGETAPARGLTMVGIEYEKEPALTVTGENEHWSYILNQAFFHSPPPAGLRLHQPVKAICLRSVQPAGLRRLYEHSLCAVPVRLVDHAAHQPDHLLRLAEKDLKHRVLRCFQLLFLRPSGGGDGADSL